MLSVQRSLDLLLTWTTTSHCITTMDAALLASIKNGKGLKSETIAFRGKEYH